MSNTINDGGPAFPFGQVSELTGQPINGFFNPGMTLRDWFAGQAIAGMLANPEGSGKLDVLAQSAYLCADALIKYKEAKP